jgi:hypothetical protein
MTRSDGVSALIMFGLGFLFWWWLWPSRRTYAADWATGSVAVTAVHAPGVVVPLFFGLALAASLTYFHVRGLRLTWAGIVGAVAIMVASLPFALYATQPIFLPLFGLILVATVLWHGLAAGALLAERPGADLVIDLVNQGLAVPFSNFGAAPAAVKELIGGRARLGQVVIGVVGVLIGLPVFAVVVSLLASADQGFDSLLSRVGEALAGVDIVSVWWRLAMAIPTSMYLVGLAWGNAHRRGRGAVSREAAHGVAALLRRVPPTLVAAPTMILCLIYLVFFAAMGTYLFSAFSGALPADLTYSGYARRGFFELAGVATINLGVIGFTYLFARRETAYPLVLRVVGACLSGLTELLIATAISKMVLYVSAYGLTRLRLITLVFMVFLAVVFILVAAWHVKAFRVSGVVVILTVVTLVGLCWGDIDGLVARFNVDRYLSGQVSQIDLDYLSDGLSEASIPALIDLADRTSDPTVHRQVEHKLSTATIYGVPLTADGPSGQVNWDRQAPWTAWNLQSWLAQRELERR